ncbi:MAG: hypothetical protein PHO41_00980 [Eubacteriales bacterium]|nr:hypothetical protein [Eubacteriales bacterium]
MAIIGGADGPTAIFITSSPGWINWFGLLLVVLLLLPNVIWAIRHKGEQNACSNKFMNILEQIGRYGCLFFMVFNIGIPTLGFSSVTGMFVYFIGSLLILFAYWAFWIVLAKKPGRMPMLLLAILPTLLFILCGIAQRHYLLLFLGVLFGIGHIYVTLCNAKEKGYS